MNNAQQSSGLPAILPGPDGGFGPCPTVVTEDELIRFLHIPEITNAKNHRYVIENLKRKHGLPGIHLCGKTVYLADAVKQWLQDQVACGNGNLGLVQSAWTNPSLWPASERRSM